MSEIEDNQNRKKIKIKKKRRRIWESLINLNNGDKGEESNNIIKKLK